MLYNLQSIAQENGYQLLDPPVTSVSNGSIFPVPTRNRTIATGFHPKPGISTSQLCLQLSIWVLIVSWYDQYMDCAVQTALSPRDLRYVSRPIFIESLSKTRSFRLNVLFFHSHSTNIYRIANRNARDQRAARTAQFTYWSRHDMMRTQILNWNQSCRNRKMEPRSCSNPSPNPVGTPVFGVTNRTGPSGPVPNPVCSRVTQNRC